MAFVCYLMIALALMVCDYRYKYLHSLRNSVAVLVFPIHIIVDYPVRVIGWMHDLVSSKNALVNENMQLRYKQTLLEAKLQKLSIIKKENLQLRALLNTTKTRNFKTMAAQILAVETNNARQLLVVNQGTSSGVYVGQPVLDAKGVVGQVIDVSLFSCVILTVSDAKSAVPVEIHRTGERAILVGTNDIAHLSLINLPSTSSIKEGDLLMTSGLGNRYPEGFPVAVVSNVNEINGESFITVDAYPLAKLNQDRLVLLVWPEVDLLENVAVKKELS